MGLRRAIARGIGWLPLEAKPVARALGRDERETDDPVARRLSHRFERRLEILRQLIGHAQLAQRPRRLLASLPVRHDLPFSLRLPAPSRAAEQRAPIAVKAWDSPSRALVAVSCPAQPYRRLQGLPPAAPFRLRPDCLLPRRRALRPCSSRACGPPRPRNMRGASGRPRRAPGPCWSRRRLPGQWRRCAADR